MGRGHDGGHDRGLCPSGRLVGSPSSSAGCGPAGAEWPAYEVGSSGWWRQPGGRAAEHEDANGKSGWAEHPHDSQTEEAHLHRDGGQMNQPTTRGLQASRGIREWRDATSADGRESAGRPGGFVRVPCLWRDADGNPRPTV